MVITNIQSLKGAEVYELFPFQHKGAAFLASKTTACLFDEQRLGKAVQSVRALDIVGAKTALVVCRGIARANWQDEFRKWSKRPWSFTLVFGSAFDRPSNPGHPHCVITSYESLPHVTNGLAPNFQFDCAIVDESHYLKSHDSGRTLNIFGKNGLRKKTKRIWCLTGTPCPNNYAELWTTLFNFGLTKLSYWDFAKKFCFVVEDGFGPRIAGSRDDPETVRELAALMAPKVLRREARDVSIQMPKMSFSTVSVPPGKVHLGMTSFWKFIRPVDRTKEFEKLIEQELGVMNGILGQGKDAKFSDQVIETLKAQSKSISTLRKYTALQKLAPAMELIGAEMENGAYQKCVIFAHHRDLIFGAQQYLHRFRPFTIYGGSNPRKVMENVRKFQNPKDKHRVAICNISAAGTSISLNCANHIFFLEESFVPGDNAQAAMRCGGVNQAKPVFVRTFCLENSYDTRLQNILRQKMAETTALYSAIRAPLELPKLPAGMEEFI